MHGGILLIIYVLIVVSREGRKFMGAKMERSILKIGNYDN